MKRKFYFPPEVICPKYTKGIIIVHKHDYQDIGTSAYEFYMKILGILVINENNLSQDAKKYLKLNDEYLKLMEIKN